MHFPTQLLSQKSYIYQIMEPSQIKLLLIDDDEDDRDFFRMAVAEVDYPVHCELAASATQGFKILAAQQFLPHFVFLDLNMPGIDGRACLKELKSNAETQAIPVVIYSTSSEPKDVEETKQLGAVHFMTKPTGLDQLVHHINNFLKTNITNQNK